MECANIRQELRGVEAGLQKSESLLRLFKFIPQVAKQAGSATWLDLAATIRGNKNSQPLECGYARAHCDERHQLYCKSLLYFVELLVNEHRHQHQQKYARADAEDPHRQRQPVDFHQ